MIYSDKKLEKLYLKLNCGGDGGDGDGGAPVGFGGGGGVATGAGFGGGGDLGVGGEGTGNVGASGPVGGQGQASEPGFLGSIAQGFSDNMADVPTALNVGLTALGLPVAGAAAVAAGLDAITGAIGGTPDPDADVGLGDAGGPVPNGNTLPQVANGGGPLPPNASSVDAGPIPVPPPLNPGSQFTGFNIPKRTLLQQLAFGSKGGA
jgi:hypothetical protein